VGDVRGLMLVLEYIGKLVRGTTEARSVIGDLAVNTGTSEQFNTCIKIKETLNRRELLVEVS
jgi:hypothetical protein